MQVEQIVPPGLGAYFPVVQAVHPDVDVTPVPVEKYPEEHAVHTVLPVLDVYVPAAQDKQMVTPVPLPNAPELQLEQLVAAVNPMPVEYVPALQLVQNEDALIQLNVPAAQVKHVDIPVPVPYCPAPQLEQDKVPALLE